MDNKKNLLFALGLVDRKEKEVLLPTLANNEAPVLRVSAGKAAAVAAMILEVDEKRKLASNKADNSVGNS
ncbi:MAG: hypothetical protein WAV41_01485 [Microgenomates group bacterium]